MDRGSEAGLHTDALEGEASVGHAAAARSGSRGQAGAARALACCHRKQTVVLLT